MNNLSNIQIQSVSVEGAALIVLIRKPQHILEKIFDLVNGRLALPDLCHNLDELVLVLFLDQTDVLHHLIELKVVIELAHVKTQLTEDVDQGYLLLGGADVEP